MQKTPNSTQKITLVVNNIIIRRNTITKVNQTDSKLYKIFFFGIFKKVGGKTHFVNLILWITFFVNVILWMSFCEYHFVNVILWMFEFTISAFSKLKSPSSNTLGLPSSMNVKSVNHNPKYGTSGLSTSFKRVRYFLKFSVGFIKSVKSSNFLTYSVGNDFFDTIFFFLALINSHSPPPNQK